MEVKPKSMNIGIDVGNYDTKTQDTTTASSYMIQDVLPPNTDEYIYYDGKYYIMTNKRFPYQEDKTIGDQAFILSLASISKEMNYQIEKKRSVCLLQEEVNKVTELNIGVGLPPNHFGRLAEGLKEYYLNKFKNGVSYKFNGTDYNYKIKNVHVMTQGYMAATMSKSDDITKAEKKYFLVDIGGYTIDVLCILNQNKSDAEYVRSLPDGVLKLYGTIISTVQQNVGMEIDDYIIEAVLKNEKTYTPQEVKDIIFELAEKWISELLRKIQESGIDFRLYPCVFIGGGSLLVAPYIEKIAKERGFAKYTILDNARANARGYAMYLDIRYETDKYR